MMSLILGGELEYELTLLLFFTCLSYELQLLPLLMVGSWHTFVLLPFTVE